MSPGAKVHLDVSLNLKHLPYFANKATSIDLLYIK